MRYRTTFSLLLTTMVLAAPADARMKVLPDTFSQGFAPLPFISPANIIDKVLASAEKNARIKSYCASIQKAYKRYKWVDDACGDVEWRADFVSKDGHPLLYQVFGSGESTTLLLSGVHPDEITPVPLGFRVARHLKANPHLIEPGTRLVVAPLVNPDGFLREKAVRVNANGVDLNRNFFTLDWYAKAKQLWQSLREKDPRHFPGSFPNSEVETIFQIKLIDEFQPDKILSIHAPLGFLDYDGPGDQRRKLTATESQAKRLVTSISEKSQNYKVVDYTFYPGSLGNFAGNERHIPTVTLELETTDPGMVETYWKQFLPGILQSAHYPFKSAPVREAKGDNASPFSLEYIGG